MDSAVERGDSEAGNAVLRPMLVVTPSRVAHFGSFGRPRSRVFGAWMLYWSPAQPFLLQLEDGTLEDGRLALVRPWMHHRIDACGSIGMVLIEDESVDPTSIEARLVAGDAVRERTARCLRRGFSSVPAGSFDLHFLGLNLGTRGLDRRIARVAQEMGSGFGRELDAARYAQIACLSASRLTHRFRHDLGVSIKRFRAWKRARGLLELLVGERPHWGLANLAQEAGYADAAHLCRAIRSFYGYSPRTMVLGSRALSRSRLVGAPCALAA